MLKGLGDIGNIIKLQKTVKNMRKKIAAAVMEGTSATGEVKAMMNGEHRLVSLVIDPILLTHHNAHDIERTIIEAVNNAGDKIKDFSASEMKKLTGGLDLPGLEGLLNKI
jgi:DNA-binding YbaB/EbfC family protein